MKEITTGVYRAFIDTDPDAIILSDPTGAIIEVNPAACAFFGYPRAKFLRLLYDDVLVQPEQQTVKEQAADGRTKMHCLKANGQSLPAFPVVFMYPEPSGAYIKCTRIPSLKAPDDLDIIDNAFLINNSEDFIWSVSRNFTLITANNAFIDSMRFLTAVTIKPGDNLLMEKVFDAEYLVYWKDLYEKAFSGKTFKEEIYAPAQNGRDESWYEISFNPIRKSGDIAAAACYSRNITDRKKSEQIIHNSEEKRRLIMNAALDAIICIDTNGIVTFWNPQATAIFGWTEAEIIGHLLSDYIIPEPYRKMHDEGMQRYLSTGKGPALNVLLELVAINKDGQQFPIELTVLPIKQGDEAFFCAFIRNISVRKKIENDLKESIERYNMAAKATNDSIWDWDLQTNIVIRAGRKLENMLGYSDIAPEQVDEFWHRHAHPEDWNKVNQKRNLLFQNPSEVYWQDEYRLLKPDGSYANIYDKGYILRDPQGKAVRMIGASRDISAERQAKEILELSEARYRYLFDNNPACILIWHLDDFSIAEVNEASLQQYGYTRQQFLSKTVLDLRRPSEYPLIKAFAEKALGNDTFTATITWNHIDKYGQELAMQVASHRILYRNRPSILALAINITDKLVMDRIMEAEKIKKDKEITEAVITAQEKEREQIGTELHDNVAQVLVSSRLYLGLVKRDLLHDHPYIAETDKLIADAIEEIRELSHRLIPPSFHGQALREAITNLVKIYTLAAGLLVEQLIELPETETLPGNLNLAIYRIVQEQFNNIIKYAQAERVWLSIQRDNKNILLSIKDNGIGFDPIAKTHGVGLLNIKTRASLFNGRVEVTAAPGKGCQLLVYFEVPRDWE